MSIPDKNKMHMDNKVKNGIIKVGVIVLPGAQIGASDPHSRTPKRVKDEIAAANEIWKQTVNGRSQGITFKIVSCNYVDNYPKGIGRNLKDFPWHENIESILLEKGRELCPTAHVYIYYMNGDHIGPKYPNGSHTDAITFRDAPIVILSNGAITQKYILAHELGHIMYLHNLHGNIYDPNPFPGDPDHNASPHNLMYPVSDYWPAPPNKPSITFAQLQKALNTSFIY
ncbi:hypothetical protein [Neobacillus sp. D3-1R]|uniref:hypothetical protein n=1 Tax=Neobacillus sp. D3-1R TaxID=3445778 RepID=UPI003F9F7C36